MTASIDRRSARAVALALLLALAASAAPAAEAIGHYVSVIVVGRDAGAAAETTEANLGQVEHWLPIIDGVSARVPASRLDEISRTAYVVPDYDIKLQSASYGGSLATAYPREVGATDLWDRGNAGEDVTVALVDTGVANVPDLAGRVVASANLTDEESDEDTYGHGTFQAGLIAGTGASSGGRYVGVAPEASLLSVKVADANGDTSLGQVLSGVQLVDHAAERFDVRVMLLAIDSASPLPPELDPLSWALRKAWSHGIVVVVPAGNDGPDAGSIATPGEDPVLLTAGSVNDLGTADVFDDVVSDFSGRGPTRWEDEKPDVAAPGEHLVSLRAPGSTVDDENPSAVVEGAYFKGSGTSMAAAVTAGAAALVLSERPELSADDVKALLMGTATALPGGDADSVGAGVINAAAAVDEEAPLPDLPRVPDMGRPTAPFAPGRGADWERGDDGVWRWGARQWRDEAWQARRWAARSWNARSWAELSWEARQWLFEQWEARRWAARQWAARQWAARSWAARSWAGRSWAARQWTARQWAARQWSARQWNDGSWEARQWNARQWSARAWAGRSWAGRSWAGRTWAGRTWNDADWEGRSWADDDWEARAWSGRTWSGRTWSGRTWSNVAWS